MAANIAEGSGRVSSKEFIRSINIAYGFLMETISHLRIAEDQNFRNNDDFASLDSEAERLARMPSGLRASLEKQRPIQNS